MPTFITLKVLHDILQSAMGWFDCHLWKMIIDGQTYGLPMDENLGTPQPRTASLIRLRKVIQPAMTGIDYTYDFGDNWEHSLNVSNVRPGDSGTGYSRFIAGERDGPPEDCGGLPGSYEVLEARADPTHPDRAEISEWLDGSCQAARRRPAFAQDRGAWLIHPRLIAEQGDMTLVEVQARPMERGTSVAISTVHRFIQRHGITR